MTKPTTVAFVCNEDMRDQLRQWAKQDDRSISAVIRRAIEAEAERRQRARKAAAKR